MSPEPRFRIALAGACAALSLSLYVPDARATDTPRIGPIPIWVHAPPALPVEKDAAKALPVAVLLHDMQIRVDADGWTEFHEIEAKAQSSAGLQGLGAIPFRWSPWSDTLTFHRARILRDGQSIDVLPKDGGFTVLRRETGLEQAMLTGELTAVLQPEGLQVGDVLEVAVSIRHADPLLKGHSSAFLAGWDLAATSRVRLEASWPSSLAVRWKETAGLPILHPAQAAGLTTVAMDLDDVLPPVLPAHAPRRFQHGRQVEFTTFAGWDQVAAAMAPLFTEAATLPPNSPVAEQARQIAQASADPKSRAAAALHLVQGQVRYLAHAEAGGGLKPQSADETWRLRYGDCKAKTALLLALLNQLGVPAEPVLASSTGGDGLDAHLPSVGLFDHVLVRVQLGGRDYWLDGAREGDRSLDELTTPAFGWVLPLVPKSAMLVRIEPSPSARPQMVQVIRYDASGGVTAPEPTHLDTLFTGIWALSSMPSSPRCRQSGWTRRSGPTGPACIPPSRRSTSPRAGTRRPARSVWLRTAPANSTGPTRVWNSSTWSSAGLPTSSATPPPPIPTPPMRWTIQPMSRRTRAWCCLPAMSSPPPRRRTPTSMR